MSPVLAVPGIESNFFTLTLLLQNLTNALANGAVYALMALTVVMIYKTTGHLNFAQGEMAMFSTFVVYVLAIEQGLPVWLAIGVVVIASMIVGAAFERILIQPLESRSVLAPVILTLGLFFILNGGAATVWGGLRSAGQYATVCQPFDLALARMASQIASSSWPSWNVLKSIVWPVPAM